MTKEELRAQKAKNLRYKKPIATDMNLETIRENLWEMQEACADVKDHVHILFRGQPNTEISKFINAYKSASSRLIKKEYPQIRTYLWKEMFWSQSFCLLTTGGATVDIIKQYIQSQGRKDGKQSN